MSIYRIFENGLYKQFENGSFVVSEGAQTLDILVRTIPTEIPTEPYLLSGQCTDQSTIILTSDTGCIFSAITYDRTKIPLNDWSCEVTNMAVGNNTITATCFME